MDGITVVIIVVALVIYLGPIALLVRRLRRIKRYGVHGGEFNQPFATAGYGGVLPGTELQQNFGGTTTAQTASVQSTSEPDDQPWRR